MIDQLIMCSLYACSLCRDGDDDVEMSAGNAAYGTTSMGLHALGLHRLNTFNDCCRPGQFYLTSV